MNEFVKDEPWIYAKCLKKEGVVADGDTAQIKESDAIKCTRCRRASTPLYSKKYGLFLHNQFFCQNCKSNIGQCFICRTMFESNKDLSDINPTQLECKDCLKTVKK